MLMFLVFRLLAGCFTFLLPSYSTFKALRKHPLNEREIERWVSYWIVIAPIVAFEYTTEWLLCWFPFYWEIKTLLLLYLSLPQFEGSTYVYKTYLEPYLVQNESDIDASIASARYETLQFVQTRLSALWDIVYSLLNKTPMTTPYAPSSNGSPSLPNQGGTSWQQSLMEALNAAPSLPWATPAPPTGEPAISRSTRAFENRAPSPAAPAGAPSTAGYDVDVDDTQ